MAMTFEEFQKSGRFVPSVAKALDMHADEIPGDPPGVVFAQGFYIEWHEDDATWYCLCENDDFASIHRTEVERWLWDALAKDAINETV